MGSVKWVDVLRAKLLQVSTQTVCSVKFPLWTMASLRSLSSMWLIFVQSKWPHDVFKIEEDTDRGLEIETGLDNILNVL